MGEHSRQSTDNYDMHGFENRPFESLGFLRHLVQESDTLKQLIEIKATNVAGLGFGIKYQSDFDFNRASEVEKNKATEEWVMLDNLYKYCNHNQKFSDLVKDIVYMREMYGFAFIEVLRNGLGQIAMFLKCKPDGMYIMKERSISKSIKRPVNVNGKIVVTNVAIEFKVYCQTADSGEKIYFKEFGNTDRMNYKTGEFDENTPDDELATELIHFKIEDGWSEYGTPRWSQVIIDTMSSIKASKVNFDFFENGRINPMVMTVIGAKLDDKAVSNLQKNKGIEKAHAITVLNVEPSTPDSHTANPNYEPKLPKVEVHQLVPNTHDNMYQELQKNIAVKIKETFCLPPIYSGSNSDYNRATADTARAIAEEQVFAPDRELTANLFNIIINSEMNIKYVEMHFNSPVLSSSKEVMELVQMATNSGIITPNEGREITGELLNRDYEALEPESGDVNLQVQRLRAMQKKQGV